MSEISRPASRLLLSNALRAAHYYDGSEQAYDRLIASGSAFEAYAEKAGTGVTREAREANASRELRTGRMPVTVDGLLATAIERFDKSVSSGSLDLKVQQTGLILLPTNGHNPIERGEGTGRAFEKPQIAKRAEALIKDLNCNGVFTDDMVISVGEVQPGAMRGQSYTLIQLPRHDREIMVCDEVGNASFVGRGMRGAAFWATYRKEHLGQFKDITRVVNSGDANARVVNLVLNDNPIRPKSEIAKLPKNPPLTDEIVLIHILRHAEMTGEDGVPGKLPGQYSGAVLSLTGENWAALEKYYKNQSRGLGKNEITSLAELARSYGLRNGRIDNVEAIAAALETLNRTGHHGLYRRNQDEYKPMPLLILKHCLWHAAAHNYVLPTERTGEIETMPGSKFKNLDMWLRSHGHGGLNTLYRAAGLMFENTDKPGPVRAACDRLTKTGEHGLTLGDPEEARWTLDKLSMQDCFMHASI